jgi:hypothetical protein
MRTATKLMSAFVIFVVVVLFCSHEETSTRLPYRLKSLAEYYRKSVGPERLRKLANNVLAESSTNNMSPSIGKAVRDFPAPANPWIVDGSTNSIVFMVSHGGFSSYSLIIGPEWYSPADLHAEEIAPGIYINSR